MTTIHHQGAGRGHRAPLSAAERFAAPGVGALLGLIVAVLLVAVLVTQ